MQEKTEEPKLSSHGALIVAIDALERNQIQDPGPLETMTRCSPELSVISCEEDSDTSVGCFVLDSFIKSVLIHLMMTDVSMSSFMIRQKYQSSSPWQGRLESTIRNLDPGVVLTKAPGVLKDLNSMEYCLGMFLFGCNYFYHPLLEIF